ncbi:FAD-dependent monooxygenase, partial [Janibacter sp. LM]|uniref:FAD-dependent monooxygenase n=1 Tax=Janibacter sp. LM TaxID=3144845 RepID=UPI0031F672E5
SSQAGNDPRISQESPNSPRAHITNQRALEVFRDLGIEDQVTGWATPQSQMGEHVFATSLSGEELGRLRTWYTHPRFQAEHDLASPTSICDIPQHLLEPILVNTASSRGSTVRFNTELLTITDAGDHVVAHVRDRVTGGEYSIRARYAIGADGGNSIVAQQAGLPFEGEMGVSSSINVDFEADLSHLVSHRQGDMYWFIQPGVGHDGNGIGVLRMIRPWTRWVGVWGFEPSDGPADLSDANGVRIAHKLIGDSSVPVRVESMSTWAVNKMVATDNTAGRIFCVGDAVHRHSPMNGLGSNTSVQDSFNLCWKLALVLREQASSALLETYRDERVPVGRQIVDRASRSNDLMPPLFMALQVPPNCDEQTLETAIKRLAEPTPEGLQRRQEFDAALAGTLLCFNAHGIELNQHYDSAAVVTDGSDVEIPERDEELHYFPSTRPGRHLPHAWLTRDQRRVALLDLCGRGQFTLLTGVAGDVWHEAARTVADELGVALTIHAIGRGCEHQDSYGDFAAVRDIEDDGALLVRPDHMIGWRAADSSGDAAARLRAALGAILGRA